MSTYYWNKLIRLLQSKGGNVEPNQIPCTRCLSLTIMVSGSLGLYCGFSSFEVLASTNKVDDGIINGSLYIVL